MTRTLHGARRLLLMLLAGTALSVLTVGVSSTTQPAQAAYPASKVISIAGDDQDNGYYCGPAAVRNALSGRGVYSVQSDLARQMGTDSNGTDSVANVTPVLNSRLHTTWYESKYIGGNTASASAKALLKNDILLDVNKGYVIVANIVGTATDESGHSHSYSGGHYLDVVGYRNSGSSARIYDVASGSYYWMSTSALADWIAGRGYSA